MTREDAKVEAAIEYLGSRLPVRPVAAVILGSGLGAIAGHCTTDVILPYADIPGFPLCSVEGHAGQLVIGKWGGLPVALLQGRAHRYEGYSLEHVTRPIRALAKLGVQTVVTTCAAGSVGNSLPGEVLVIKDHLNLMGDNPLLGLRDSVTGSAQFVEMAGAYDAHLRQAVRDAAAESGLLLREGVLACVAGPTYETAAEAEMLGRLGAQAVSMSLVPEVIVARAFQLQVLGLAVLTNRAGLPLDHRLGHHQVVAEAESKVKTVAYVIETVLRFLQAMETKPRGKGR